MADHYLGINRGNVGFQDNQFTYGTSTGSTDIELRIADGVAWTRQEVILALEMMEVFLTEANPAIAGTEFPVNT